MSGAEAPPALLLDAAGLLILPVRRAIAEEAATLASLGWEPHHATRQAAQSVLKRWQDRRLYAGLDEAFAAAGLLARGESVVDLVHARHPAAARVGAD